MPSRRPQKTSGARLGIAIELDLAPDVDVPGEVTENLLRIVREAVTNVAMHGHAPKVTVRLEQTDTVRLVIEATGVDSIPTLHRCRAALGS